METHRNEMKIAEDLLVRIENGKMTIAEISNRRYHALVIQRWQDMQIEALSEGCYLSCESRP